MIRCRLLRLPRACAAVAADVLVLRRGGAEALCEPWSHAMRPPRHAGNMQGAGIQQLLSAESAAGQIVTEARKVMATLDADPRQPHRTGPHTC